MASTMQAWQLSAPGPVDKTLTLAKDVPRPSEQQLKNAQILVKVAYAALNPADYRFPELGFVSRALISYPTSLGMDLSGRVVAIADDVEDVKVGQLVMAHINAFGSQGALSEYVVVEREGYSTLSEKVDLKQAAGAPVAAMTAYQTIAPHVKKGDKIFINGGSGGVGTFGIQIAKLLGCHVTVTCSTNKVNLCKKLGADEIIDYKKCDVIEELEDAGERFTLVVDNVGDSPPNLFNECHKFLLPENKGYIFVGGHVGSVASLLKAQFFPKFLGGTTTKFTVFFTPDSRGAMTQISSWMAEEKLRTVIDSEYSFEEVPKALEHLKKGSSGGKVVIRVGEV
ncbi:hypothetical protein jhhlp_008367 [Lomentospora prolificans]|uniref:Enoyl reductase (ER) domain-containing protein n=1 Tax=Lomentospora prolificans TaxID=41688 RepID=A0A2N3MXU3_9PEZI|nr:hypothetical protein jhhlp_008367 [Lomentospora prolificans]